LCDVCGVPGGVLLVFDGAAGCLELLDCFGGVRGGVNWAEPLKDVAVLTAEAAAFCACSLSAFAFLAASSAFL